MDLYAVIGNPIRHSLSPKIHQQFAKQTQQQINYIAIEAPPAQFKSVLDKFFFIENGLGASITSPFKYQAAEICHHLTSRARIAKAVNCIKKIDNQLWGDNTDGIGFIRDLENHQISLQNKKILILGAGGAVAGILSETMQKNPEQIILYNRSFSKAQNLAQEFPGILAVSDIYQTQPADFIINATTAHLDHHWPWPDLPHYSHTFCFDLFYQATTPFQKWAQENKLSSLNGLGMLIEQAAEAFFWWREIFPNTQILL